MTNTKRPETEKIINTGKMDEIYLADAKGNPKYKLIGPSLGSGAFGTVKEAFRLENKTKLAAKIVKTDRLSFGETVLWLGLHHKNVMPIIEIMEFEHETIFIMPLMKMSMGEAIYEYNASMIPKWFSGILEAIHYLHQRGLCHLDIKLDNVMISQTGEAVLSDFSFLNSTEKKFNHKMVGLPMIYRPPEAWPQARNYGNFIDGKTFDSWAFGMLAFETLTKQCLWKCVPKTEKWHDDVLPYLQMFLGPNKVANFLHLDETDQKIAVNLIAGFLREDPSIRISAAYALKLYFSIKPE